MTSLDQDARMTFLVARGKHAFMQTLERSGFVSVLGRERFFRRTEDAILQAWQSISCDHVGHCPLHVASPRAPATPEAGQHGGA